MQKVVKHLTERANAEGLCPGLVCPEKLQLSGQILCKELTQTARTSSYHLTRDDEIIQNSGSPTYRKVYLMHTEAGAAGQSYSMSV